MNVNHGDEFDITFRQNLTQFMPHSTTKVALMVTPEYEGIFRNGGIGTYYQNLVERLATEGFFVVLLLCQTQDKFAGEAVFSELNHVFSTQECQDVLNLSSTQQLMLSQFREWQWVDYDSYCALFFAEAIATTFPNAYIYIEFPEMLGLGYRTVQAKRSGILGDNCVVAVTLHSGQEWLQEAQAKYTQPVPQWFWQTNHYEQYSFEQADLGFYLSYFLKEKVEKYGWKTDHALHLPYCFSIIDPIDPTVEATSVRSDLQPLLSEDRISLVFFGRLEVRKGLLTFLDALHRLDSELIEKVHILFLGKSTELQLDEMGKIDSQDYIRQTLGETCCYTIVTDLFSREAIQLVTRLHSPVVCLTSPQENFPNTALEMGQLPVRLVVADTGGFREPLSLMGRTEGVYWFVPEEGRSLTQAITQAIANDSEPFIVPSRESLQVVNQQLLHQRFQYMKEQYARKQRAWILGMTSNEEQLFLENYAQYQYLGQGEIVELGCWLGSSTISLAMGLEKNRSILDKSQRIHAYDLFIWMSAAGMDQNALGTSVEGTYQDGDSFLDEYLERIAAWKGFVKVYPGDITNIGWQQKNIECLFIDAMKSWELANSILQDFFPHLIPELSLVIHQDFAHYYTSWIHLLMYRLRDYLVPIEHPYISSSRVFQLVKSIPDHILQDSYSFDSFTLSEVEASFAYSYEITHERMRSNILAAKVMYFVHIRDFETAKSVFKQAIAELDHDEWLELADVQKAARTYFSVDLLN